MKFCLRVVLLLICVSSPSFARDHEFHGVVTAIEHQYGVRHTHIPFLGFAMFFARPEGVSGFKLAIFENLHSSSTRGDDLRPIVESSLGEGWHLFVSTHSREDGENTLIYTNLSDGNLQMLIVSIEPDEATVVEMKLSERAMKKWMDEPKASAEDQTSHRHHLAQN
jgi:hypothetical protein